MTIHIPLLNGLVVVAAIIVGCVVFRHSHSVHSDRSARGDLSMAIAAAAAVVLILAFLFGLGDGSAGVRDSPASSPASAAPGDRTPPPASPAAAIR
ncbi:hypothetical protein [Streptomyces sp. NPDC006335]|uniref:hypothetical protein n=1 Tax=Streptomyces sp. NPDC006335 TaxID=3156895 RepID=UPI0033A87501